MPAGSSARLALRPAAAFLGAPRFHQGGMIGLRPGEVPIIAERGERILPRGAGVAVPPPPVIIINNNG